MKNKNGTTKSVAVYVKCSVGKFRDFYTQPFYEICKLRLANQNSEFRFQKSEVESNGEKLEKN